MQIPRYSELSAATVMTTDLFMISIMVFESNVTFIVSETGMWSLAKALSQSRPNQPVDKQTICSVPLFENASHTIPKGIHFIC